MNKIRLISISVLLTTSILFVTSCGKRNEGEEHDTGLQSTETQTESVTEPQTEAATEAETGVKTELQTKPQTTPATEPQTEPDPRENLNSFLDHVSPMFDSTFSGLFGKGADAGKNQRAGSGSQGYIKQVSPLICVYFCTQEAFETPDEANTLYMDCGVGNIFEGRKKIKLSDLEEMFGTDSINIISTQDHEKLADLSYGGYSFSFIFDNNGEDISEFTLYRQN